MAKIKEIIKWQEANDYLLDLRNTIVDDISPLLNTVGCAPFAISREALSYIDHLGHLFSGKGNNNVGDRSKLFLRKVMSQIDPNYSNRAEEIYQMYRCGTIHEFDPKVLENNKGYRLNWLCYKGERISKEKINNAEITITHLVPNNLNQNGNMYWLPISTQCLIKDIIESINIFITIGPDDERITAWNRAARELSIPVPYDFKI